LLAGALILLVGAFTPPAVAAERELIRDPHFQHGFFLLEPKPGKRVVYGELPGLNTSKPLWDLAQWSSKFPLTPHDIFSSHGTLCYSNHAKRILVGLAGTPEADLSLGVNASSEYGSRARKSGDEPWVHLLVQQDFENPPAMSELAACQFRVDARLKRSTLFRTDDYSPARHAAQFLIYLTIGNRNNKSPGYNQCFWFGIPVYDDRHRVVPAYEAQDFGATKLFIFTASSDTFSVKSTHEGEWVTLEKDLLPLMRQGLEHAWTRKFITGSHDPADFRPLGIFIGWEVPGIFDVDLQIRDLSLRAIGQRPQGASPSAQSKE
jgi:hypothetical protein